MFLGLVLIGVVLLLVGVFAAIKILFIIGVAAAVAGLVLYVFTALRGPNDRL